MNKQGQIILRTNSDHGQLSEEMWQFLYDIYGGGPELISKQQLPPSSKSTRASSPVRSSGSMSSDRASSPVVETKNSGSKDSGIDSSSQRSESSVKEDTSVERTHTKVD